MRLNKTRNVHLESPGAREKYEVYNPRIATVNPTPMTLTS